MNCRGAWSWIALSVTAACCASAVGTAAPAAGLPAGTGNPLGDPRRAVSSDDRAADDHGPRGELRTAWLDPTSENRDLFVPEPLPPVGPEVSAAAQDQAPSKLPPGAKPGILQQLSLSETFLPGGGSADSLGMNDIAFRATLGFPFFTIESPLLVSPGYTMHLLDGPASLDVPPRLYEAYVEFRWLRRLTPKLGMDLAVTPGVFSDFNRVGPSSIRIQGRGLAAFDWSQRLRIVAGVLYLDRDDIRILPAGGVIWNPHDNARYELVFPRPKIARRIVWSAASAWWAYVLGELGGNSFGATLAGGGEDTLTYRDFRVILGIERKVDLGLSAYFETGYVFGRELEYLTGPPGITPSSTVLVRGGLTY